MSSKKGAVVSKVNVVDAKGVGYVIDMRAIERVEQIHVAPHRDISPKRAMQLAVLSVMFGLESWSVDLKSLKDTGREKSRPFPFKKIAFDSFNFADDADYPNAVIAFDGMVRYAGDSDSEPGLSTHVPENETVDKFGKGTQLKHVTDAWGFCEIRTELANSEDRDGLHAAIVRGFVHETKSMRPNRRVVVPAYYDQTCRIELLGVDDNEPPSEAIQNRWPLVARLRTQISVVILVPSQPDLHLQTFVSASQDADALDDPD